MLLMPNKKLLYLVLAFLLFFLVILKFFFFGDSSLLKGFIDHLPLTVKVVSRPPVKLLFTGDLMMDRYIRQIAQEKGYDYILADVKALFLSKDLVIANLEGPITDNASVSIYSEIGSSPNFVFTFDPVIVQTLKSNNILLVGIGNNHIGNMGAEGITQTKKYLTEGGIDYFGYAGPHYSEPSFIIKNIGGLRLGFVNYNEFVEGGKEKAFADMNAVRDSADVVILVAHWGYEYVPISPEYVQVLAHEFIDAGVGLVIGAHPHVIQQKEVYKGKTIYYSLGNFVMDQYFSAETQKGMLVEATIDPKDLSMEFEEHYVQMDLSAQTKLLPSPQPVLQEK